MLLKPSHKILATILVKNEADIIAKTLEHHINQGIENFIVTDNNSTDHTRSIISKYPEVKEIIDEPDDTHHQSKWVTRMARLACKFHPDWIVHLDADELWCGFAGLKTIANKVVSSERVYLHPPVGDFDLFDMRFYLDFDDIQIPQECKIIHRPDPDIVITHGNHAVEGVKAEYCPNILRHHYPIRSLEQWRSKALGHLSLQKRQSVCERWQMWHDLLINGQIEEKYREITETWQRMIVKNNREDLLKVLGIWSTKKILNFFQESTIPQIRQWFPAALVSDIVANQN